MRLRWERRSGASGRVSDHRGSEATEQKQSGLNCSEPDRSLKKLLQHGVIVLSVLLIPRKYLRLESMVKHMSSSRLGRQIQHPEPAGKRRVRRKTHKLESEKASAHAQEVELEPELDLGTLSLDNPTDCRE